MPKPSCEKAGISETSFKGGHRVETVAVVVKEAVNFQREVCDKEVWQPIAIVITRGDPHTGGCATL